MASMWLRNALARSPLQQFVATKGSLKITQCVFMPSCPKFTGPPSAKPVSRFRRKFLMLTGCSLAAGVGLYAWTESQMTVACEDKTGRHCTPSKMIRTGVDKSGLKLTFYQYVTCPFCCKTRAYLDYHGFDYDLVEVNSVWKTQLKWSKYPKVPILCADGIGEEGFVQMNESSVIISILSSHSVNPSVSLEQLTSYYPYTVKKERGRTKYEFDNKYFVMYGDAECKKTKKQLKEEMKWRKWADDVLLHMVSPNCYRTPSESLQAFHHYSEAGDWRNQFSSFQRLSTVYAGAFVMYVIGKLLKKKYKLNDDVRVSLYENCDTWVDAIGKDRLFMGGDQPNLADLSVYGILCSMEGCQTFQDMVLNSKIGDWYYRTKTAVEKHHGAKFDSDS